MQEALKTIIHKAQKGNSSAFAFLVKEYQDYAFSLAFRILCDEEESKDTVQESFIKIWKKIGEFEPARKFTTWMYTIVTNVAIDKLRARKRRNIVNINEIVGGINTLTHDQLNIQMENKEIGQIIQYIAEELPEKQRLVFVLRDLQGLDSSETQEILNETEDFVKSNLYLARKRIKEKLIKIMEYERR